MSLLYGTTVGIIIDNNIILILKSNSDRLLSILLKIMIVGEAIAKLAITVRAQIMEDGVFHVLAWYICSSFAEQAFTLIKGISICGTNSNLAQVHKLASIDW